MQGNNETALALAKMALMWIGAAFGSITLSKLVLFATLVYTCMQCYVLWRDKIRGRDDHEADACR